MQTTMRKNFEIKELRMDVCSEFHGISFCLVGYRGHRSFFISSSPGENSLSWMTVPLFIFHFSNIWEGRSE